MRRGFDVTQYEAAHRKRTIVSSIMIFLIIPITIIGGSLLISSDLYMVGSRQDDGRIRDWAKRANVDPARVRSGSITLNHDGGRWLSLGLPGELPAVVREVNGQWQRQP